MYLAELGAPPDEWHRETAAQIMHSVRDAPECVRHQRLMHCAAHPVVRAMINFAADRWPGTDASEDVTWAATIALERREIAVNRDAGIDGGLSRLSLGVLDWIEESIGRWDDPSFTSLVRAEVDELLDAGRRGRERGLRLRRRERLPPPRAPMPAGWSLRHPSDHHFRSARARASDEHLCELLDAQIALLADSYDRLAAQHAPQLQGDLVIELEVLPPVPSGWNEPVATSVLTVKSGSAAVGDRLGLRLVADPAATTFNGTLISLRAEERWLTCADRVQDGTIIPHDGTRRIAA